MKAFVSAFAAILVVSCSETSTIGGIEDEFYRPLPPEGDSTLVIEEDKFEARFDTTTAELYTVYQRVEGNKVLLKGDEYVEKKHFADSLDLNALFAHPEKVYVSDANLLAKLEENAVDEGKTTVETKEETDFVRNILKQDFKFTLNAGEEIKASTKYEKCVCDEANAELSFTAIRNIEWNVQSSRATKDDLLSCEDSTVYNVVLAYDVTLIRNDNTATRTQTESNYTVEVPYQRIYKAGNHKISDEFDEEKTKRELIVTSENTYAERFTVVTYENWSESGRVNEKEETITVPVVFNAPEAKWVITTNAAYVTTDDGLTEERETSEVDGYWTVKSKPFSYTFTANNNVDPFTRVYSGVNNAVTFEKGDIVVEFGYGEWSIKERETTISKEARNVEYRGESYDGYDYLNSIDWTYSVKSDPYVKGNNEISHSAQAAATILIAKQPDEKLSDELGNVKREIVTDEEGNVKERITVTTYENWRDAGEKNEVTDVREFPIVFKAPEHRQRITTSPDYETKSQGSSEGKESTETDENWTVTTKSFSYSSKAENGIDSFTNMYEYSSRSVVYKKGKIELQFDYGTWTIEEDETTISDHPRDVTYNEVVYDGYDYVNKVNWTYTIAEDENVRRESKTSNSAKAEVLLLIEKDKLVKKEGTNVQHQIVDENTDKFTWDEVETWSHGEKKTTPKEWIRHRHFKARERQSVYTNNKEYTTGAGTTQMIQEKESDEGNMHVTTRYMRYIAQSNNGDRSFDNVYDYDYQRGVYTDKDNMYTLRFEFPTWTIEENGTNVSATSQKVGDYAVWLHTHNVKHNYVVTYEGISNSKAGEAQALTDIYILDVNTLETREGRNVRHQILDENTDKFTWDEVETWSNGETKTVQKEWVRYRHFQEPQKQKVYANSKDFETNKGTSHVIRDIKSVDNGVEVTTRYASYTATSSNGGTSFNNVYTYDYQKGVYTDKDKKYTLTFDFPEWTIDENGTDVSLTSTKDGDYTVWDHTHHVNHTYKVTCESVVNTYPGNGQAHTDIYILDIEKNLPDKWGEILGIQVTAVPADDVVGHYEKHAFCLRTSKGAVAVVISRDKALPTIEEFNAAYFVEGDFDETYNSAFYTTQKNHGELPVGKWAPAVGKDANGGVHYYYKGRNVANVSGTDLTYFWKDWHNGPTVQVNGYETKLENGVLTLTAPTGESIRLH